MDVVGGDAWGQVGGEGDGGEKQRQRRQEQEQQQEQLTQVQGTP